MIEKIEYVDICTFLGSYPNLIQGTGGNFSVKYDNELLIKSSGKRIVETTLTSGYVICDLTKLNTLLDSNNDNSIDAVIGGDNNTSPSMEVFFHMIPKKWIIHMHPTFMLKRLCRPDWNKYSYGMSTLSIPYVTPGMELSTTILSRYNGEQLILLQNHGIILCVDTVFSIFQALDVLYTSIEGVSLNFGKVFEFSHAIRGVSERSFFLKPYDIHNVTLSEFLPLTPDIALFLKKKPLVADTSELLNQFQTYREIYNEYPSVIVTPMQVYICGISYRQCLCIEEILKSYIDIISVGGEFRNLDQTNVVGLSSSKKEIVRLNMY
jgi:rhamnose utilization protein RhaD (predicted bifunctional aldolase and dehydrogenase)